MNTSQSPDNPEVERQVVGLLQSLATQDPHATVSASSISAHLDISANVVRRILSKLAIQGAVKPRLVMTCTNCGTEDDTAVAESESEQFCHVCGEKTVHYPAVVFDLAAPLQSFSRGAPQRPKPVRRKRMPRLLRPGNWLGAKQPPKMA